MTWRTFSRFGGVIGATGVVLAMTVAALAVPLGMLAHVGSGEPAPFALSGSEQRSYVFSADGQQLAVLKGDENRQPIALSEVPPHVVSAILAVEDKGFWTHDGIDVRGLMRAFGANVGSGGISQGGSTITQQLVKLLALDSEKTLDRKVKEMVMARRLERVMTKEQILERYLNTVYFGNGAYGIQAAAETYYGVPAGQLDLAQAALLAGIVRSPNSYNPVASQERAIRRRGVVLDRMRAQGLLTKAEADYIDVLPVPTVVQQVLPPPDDYFVEVVKQQLLDDESFGLGSTKELRTQALFSSGLRIYTTFDPDAQNHALNARNGVLDSVGAVGGVFDTGQPAVRPDGTPFTDPNTGQPMVDPATGEPLNVQGTAAVVSIEPTTGAVRTMVGGPDFHTFKFNLVTQNVRQGGSSFKTFVLTAMMELGYSPNDLVDGSGPCIFSNPQGEPNPYEVGNFAESSGGVGTITQQTARSSNCAFVRMGLIAGDENYLDVARRLGVTTDFHNNIMSSPLGTQGITPLEMAGAYAALANDGMYNKPYFIDRIEDASGRIIYQHTPAPQQAVSAQTARLVTSVLTQNVASGTGTRARLDGRQVAGKTGTAQGAKDAWFVGYTRQLATAVWIGGIGGEVPISLGGVSITGGRLPAMIWHDAMAPVHERWEPEDFPAPEPPAPGRFLTVPGGVDLTPHVPDEPPPDEGGDPPPFPNPSTPTTIRQPNLTLPTFPPPMRTTTTTMVVPPPDQAARTGTGRGREQG